VIPNVRRSTFVAFLAKFCTFLKVEKSQRHFFLELHCLKNEWNIKQILPFWGYGVSRNYAQMHHLARGSIVKAGPKLL